MKAILVVLACWVGVQGWAQKARKNFKMPKNITSRDYMPGRVMVKVKKDYKDAVSQMSGRSAGGRIKNVSVRSIYPMVSDMLKRKGESMRGPIARRAVVDISQYYHIKFDPGQNIEDFINQLYATGYFEIVEPSYVHHSSFTPNDPSIANQYYLTNINAYKAWDITQDADTLTIAIVDTGGNLDHPDLTANLYRNWKEYPPNGQDDDGDGFIDNYQGWDFIGSDTLNLDNPNFIGDNDPSVFEGGEISHGTMVGGCASASTNNGIGIAGVGFNTKLMFTKQTADDQSTSDGSIYLALDGILYAANEGIKIINCSFGGPYSSQIEQDIINHVTLDLGCLVIAAAGNGGNNDPSYPGAYDNVLSAGATDSNDARASFSSFGNTVDIAAPGLNIYTTAFDKTYATVSGTSFSSPITAGAAALVWSVNPTYTGLQVGEQLRVTADAQALNAKNPPNILGKGRLDIYRALTISSPSVRASNPKLVNQNGSAPNPGDVAFLTLAFTNYLASTSSGIQVTISTTSAFISINKNSISPGIIPTNSTITNAQSPFQLTIDPTTPENSVANLLITYSDGDYSDYQFISFIVNPSYLDVNSNLVTTTVTEIGRLGYQDPANSAMGSGFVFNQQPMLFEMGLIMGTSSTNLYNNVRGINGGFDEDFTSTVKIRQITPGVRSFSEIFGEFSNSDTVSDQAVVIDYRSLVWKDSPYDKFVIIEYKLKNPTNQTINGFHFGIFADWDITTDGQQDAANFYAPEKLGYIYPAQTAAKPYAGIQLLTGTPNYYAIDNDPTIAGNPFGLYDGFTDVEKYTTISTQRLTAGLSTPDGDDVSHVVSTGPLTIGAGQVITLAFALHAAANLNDLKTSAAYADSIYNYTLKAPVPVVDTVKVCYNSPATITASGASKLNWYKTFTGGTPFFTGSQFVTNALTSDTTFYISNADSSYESVRVPGAVILAANPKISASGSTTFCEGQSIILSVAKADSYLWSNGATTQSITVDTTGSYSVTVKNNSLSCTSNSIPVTTKVNPSPIAKFNVTGDSEIFSAQTFTDQSVGAVSWYWQFGDNGTSDLQNPTYSYVQIKNFTVKLTVTSDLGCQSSVSHMISIITGLEDTDDGVFIYPNPVRNEPLVVEVDEKAGSLVKVSLINMLGQSNYEDEFQTGTDKTQREIPVRNLPEGIYIIKINVGGKLIARKIVISQ